MKICYFGIYDPHFGRNRVYMRGLGENGITVIECHNSSPGLAKFWRLWQKHRALRGKYDALLVGYPGHLVVPFAKLISRKPVIADLLGSLADAETQSHRSNLIRRFKNVIIDRLAVWCADSILLESEAQKKFFEERFGHSRKYHVLYTGADDTLFHCENKPKDEMFIVLFRGRLTPESGVLHILKAAALLKNENTIRFRVVGSGPLLPQTEAFISENGLTNVELISAYLSEDVLCEKMCDASLSLGQFENNPRLSRTIPHKAFESFALGIPYLSGDAPAVHEVITDGETGFLVPLADPYALAEKIRTLSADPAVLARVATAAQASYKKRFAPRALAAELLRLLSSHE